MPTIRIVLAALISLAAAAGATSLGLFQDLSDLSDNVPHWSRSTVLVVSAPLIVALVVFIALQNAVKHSATDRVDVALSRVAEQLEFRVADRGIGFRPDEAHGVGIQNLRDRLGAIGGALTIESRPGGGAVVTGRIPLGG